MDTLVATIGAGWLWQVALPREGEEAAALPARLAAAMLQSQLNPAAVQAERAPGECNQLPPSPPLQSCLPLSQIAAYKEGC